LWRAVGDGRHGRGRGRPSALSGILPQRGLLRAASSQCDDQRGGAEDQTRRPSTSAKVSPVVAGGRLGAGRLLIGRRGGRAVVRRGRILLRVEGEQVSEKIDTVTWSGGRIRPGEFEEFGVSFRTPNEPGTELAFPAVQTYSSGEVVRWIGPPDADEPAPRVMITEPQPEEGQAAPPAATPAQGSAPADEESSSDTLSIIALIAGIAGIATGLVALFWRGRRPKATRPHREATAR
jgi:hypothetical protein